jgi:hypothetical protein
MDLGRLLGDVPLWHAHGWRPGRRSAADNWGSDGIPELRYSSTHSTTVVAPLRHHATTSVSEETHYGSCSCDL